MNLLTNRLTELYSNLATPHCVDGNSSPVYHDAQPRPYAVFLCVLHGNIVLMGYVGKPSGLPVRDTGLLPCIARHHCLAGSDDGFNPLYHESIVMQNTTQVASATTVSIPSVSIVNDQVKTTSLDVAEFFGKRHSHILRAIENLECSPEFTSAHFWAHAETIQAGAVQRESKYYEMTKDGFTFLVMGFTGKRAAQFKEAYINRFNELETALHNPLALTNGQHYVVAKDGVVVYHKVLTERTAQKYLPQHSSTDCERALKLVSELQAVNQLSGTVDYWQVRAALQQLTTHLHQHQPSSQMKPAIAVLEAVERMMMKMWTMVDEGHSQAGIIKHCTKDSKTLTDDNVQTIKNILGTLSRENMRVELPRLH
jgi:Rha family phage regulatory protein